MNNSFYKESIDGIPIRLIDRPTLLKGSIRFTLSPNEIRIKMNVGGVDEEMVSIVLDILSVAYSLWNKEVTIRESVLLLDKEGKLKPSVFLKFENHSKKKTVLSFQYLIIKEKTND